jgi:serine/threonine protein kinase
MEISVQYAASQIILFFLKVNTHIQSNIFIDSEFKPLIGDFGLSFFSDTNVTSHMQSKGSLRWMAPELVLPQKFGFEHFKATFCSDVYAFGCLCLEVHVSRKI